MPKIKNPLFLTKRNIKHRLNKNLQNNHNNVQSIEENLMETSVQFLSDSHSSGEILDANNSLHSDDNPSYLIENPPEHPSDLIQFDEDVLSVPTVENIPSYVDLPLRDFIKKLYTEYNLKRVSGTIILTYLHHNYDSSLPKDIRTLLKTPRHHKVFIIQPGLYIHCGIKKSLNVLLLKYNWNNNEPVLLDIFIDGLQIARSSKRGLWVILGRISKISTSKPFIIGVYMGYNKPKNFNNFLVHFVTDMENIKKSYMLKGQSYKIDIKLVLGDSPARAAIAGNKLVLKTN
jgi:hypothetical protein